MPGALVLARLRPPQSLEACHDHRPRRPRPGARHERPVCCGRARVTKGAMVNRVSVIGTGYLGAAHAACWLPSDSRSSVWTPTRTGGVARWGSCRSTSRACPRCSAAGAPVGCCGSPRPTSRRPSSRTCTSSAWARRSRTCPGGRTPAQFEAAIDALAPGLRRPCLVVGKSTGPVGWARMAARLARRAPAGRGAELAWNPEFLREGHAVADTLAPDRIVVGVTSARAETVLREIYARPLAAGSLFWSPTWPRPNWRRRRPMPFSPRRSPSSTPWPRSATRPVRTSRCWPTCSALIRGSVRAACGPARWWRLPAQGPPGLHDAGRGTRGGPRAGVSRRDRARSTTGAPRRIVEPGPHHVRRHLARPQDRGARGGVQIRLGRYPEVGGAEDREAAARGGCPGHRL